MFSRKFLDGQMRRVGCPAVSPLKYQIPSRHESLTWMISFRLLGVYRWEIDGTVLYSHSAASVFAGSCMETLAGKWWAESRRVHKVCHEGGGFPVANLAPWSHVHTLTIKDFTAEESAERIANDVSEFVLPFINTVKNDQIYLRLLMLDEKPVQWNFCQALARFAEIAYLAARQGIGKNEVLFTTRSKRKQMSGQLRDLPVDDYMNRVLSDAYDS